MDAEKRIKFAGLTRHNTTELSDRATKAANSDHSRDAAMYPDDIGDCDTSLSSAIRNLETADATETAWKVPDKVAARLDADTINEEAPDGVEAFLSRSGDLYVETDRFPSVFSPDKLTEWAQGNHRDESGEFTDPLWHIPTKNYAIVNPLDFYEPLEEELREQELGDHVFGEVRTYKGGGEVHIEMLFDNFSIMPPEEENDQQVAADGGDKSPILLGVRTGYDFFGGTAMYAEGFAQDTWCSNSIRNVTEEKSRRHVGEPDEVREWWQSILEEMDLMTDRLAELIEAAAAIDVDYMDLEFSDAFDHNDDLQAYYELAGLPRYLAREAASHVRSRAENQFLPSMWDLHSGATYALTHAYRGGENTGTLDNYVQAANDMVMNPASSMDTVEERAQQHQQRREAEAEGELDDISVSANIESYKESIADQRDEFETKQEELQGMLVTAGGETEEADE
jgi:hypothetical protein